MATIMLSVRGREERGGSYGKREREEKIENEQGEGRRVTEFLFLQDLDMDEDSRGPGLDRCEDDEEDEEEKRRREYLEENPPKKFKALFQTSATVATTTTTAMPSAATAAEAAASASSAAAAAAKVGYGTWTGC